MKRRRYRFFKVPLALALLLAMVVAGDGRGGEQRYTADGLLRAGLQLR